MSEHKGATRASRVPFTLVRSWNFIRQVLSNKLALVGAVMLFVFVFMAAAAPILTPYPPQGQVVSGPLAAPVWVKYFRGDAGLSENVNFANPTASAGTGVSLNSQIPNGAASVKIVVTTASGGPVTVKESVYYPYTGSPLRFIGGVNVTLPGGSTGNSTALLFVDRFDSNNQFLKRYDLWTFSGLSNSSIIEGIDSYQQALLSTLGIAGAGTSAPDFIFSAPGRYVYTFEMTLPAGFSGNISVQNFELQLFGNTFGKLGTDAGGQDLFTQFVYGARLSLYVGLFATFIGIGLGLVIGLMAGYLGKFVDEVLMRFTDMMLVIPTLPLLIVLSFILGPSINTVVLILGFLGWMGFARLVRSQVLSLRERPFIEAAKASGAGTSYILTKHVFPNIIALLYVNLALSVPAAIVSEAALSFLGLGDQSLITWGKMLELARSAGTTTGLTWWWIIPPGLGIALLSLSFILIGYSLDELFNPRLRRRR